MNTRSSEIIVNYEGKPSYKIISTDDFLELSESIVDLAMDKRRFMIITDDNVSRYYLQELKEIIALVSKSVETFTFPAGEKSKNLATVDKCYEKLIEYGFDRNDVLIALGGGVVGDLTGFVAATYLRGIRFIQLPTSLLAMVDSSIGGKTAVDYNAYKNMVGAFHQPSLVYMNLSTLKTLPDREYYSGMGEILKHGLIKDYEYFNWLLTYSNEILAKDYNIIRKMIVRSCLIKKEIVELDPKEAGDRALLNYGHTIGHSVEMLKDLKLLHGECIGIGMAGALYISYSRGYITREEYDIIISGIKQFNLPINVSELTTDEIYQVTRLDKKMDSDSIRFILLKKIGDAFIDPSVTKEELKRAIQTIII